MAKVTMPLLSGSASGKIAGSMVHFGWKGLNVVRQLVTPSNPKTAGQGDRRLAMAAAGKAIKPVAPTSLFLPYARAFATGGQTWASALVNYIVKTFLYGSGHTAYDAAHSAYNSHGAKAEFDTDAALLGMTEYSNTYKGSANVAEPGFQLYLLARACAAIYTADHTKFNVSPCTIAIGSWTSGNVDSFKTLISAV